MSKIERDKRKSNCKLNRIGQCLSTTKPVNHINRECNRRYSAVSAEVLGLIILPYARHQSKTRDPLVVPVPNQLLL